MRYRHSVRLLSVLVLVTLHASLVHSAAHCPSGTDNTINPDLYLDEHNAYRCEVGLEPLAWDCEIAAVAQMWADDLASRGCPLEHSTSGWVATAFTSAGYVANPAAVGVGENLAWHSTNTPGNVPIRGGDRITQQWATEKQYYDMGPIGDDCIKNTVGEAVGHYTQIVWHSTRYLGCGVAECGNTGSAVFVCQYYPAGNWLGELPFCKANKPPNMGACAGLGAISDPATNCSRVPEGICPSDGASLCHDAGGVTDCGNGGAQWSTGCNCGGSAGSGSAGNGGGGNTTGSQQGGSGGPSGSGDSCSLDMDWKEITSQMEMYPNRFCTGGLGQIMENGVKEVWLCDKQHPCAPGQDAMCFKYHEIDEEFMEWGLNSELKLFDANA
mmetsp:Transcript_43256/g.67754  ORF Transcript_43256/g.67754 Transcript_43256/m.67754 type:complete len:383 (-) Transcript_43256:178-1326(-)